MPMSSRLFVSAVLACLFSASGVCVNQPSASTSAKTSAAVPKIPYPSGPLGIGRIGFHWTSSHTPFPIVTFSHGLGSTGFQYTVLIEHLVSLEQYQKTFEPPYASRRASGFLLVSFSKVTRPLLGLFASTFVAESFPNKAGVIGMPLPRDADNNLDS
jgi:hypothetical protein